MRLLTVLLATLGLLAVPGPPALGYPERPITLIVGFGAGSGTDAMARIVAQHVGQSIRQRIVVENRPGAHGSVGGAAAARAEPDGYTLFLGTNSTHASAPSLLKKINYDPIADFAPISRVGGVGYILLVNPGLEIKTVPALLALAKSKPDALSIAVGNPSGLVVTEAFKRATGLTALNVPYRSTPPALVDVLAGRVSAMFVDMPTGLEYVKSGQLAALATASETRSPLAPDVPTLKEIGYQDLVIEGWFALYAPRGTPDEIVDRLAGEIKALVETETPLLQRLGFETTTNSPREMAAFGKSELAKWTRMIKEAGIQPE